MRLGPVLQESLDEFNVTKEVPTQDAGIVKIKNELAEVSDLMRENIHKVRSAPFLLPFVTPFSLCPYSL